MKYVLFFLIVILVSCNRFHRFSKGDDITGTYKTSYVKDQTISKDSVWVKIELYDIKDGEPLAFDRPMTTLNEHLNKEIKDNYCIAYFHRKEVPRFIFLELHRANKYPKTFSLELKENKQIIIKAYLAEDKRIRI